MRSCVCVCVYIVYCPELYSSPIEPSPVEFMLNTDKLTNTQENNPLCCVTDDFCWYVCEKYVVETTTISTTNISLNTLH